MEQSTKVEGRVPGGGELKGIDFEENEHGQRARYSNE